MHEGHVELLCKLACALPSFSPIGAGCVGGSGAILGRAVPTVGVPDIHKEASEPHPIHPCYYY